MKIVETSTFGARSNSIGMPPGKADDPWDLLAANKQVQAVRAAKLAADQEWDASEIMELGNVYMWLRKYRHALQHFQKALRTYPNTICCFYGMAGTASWCLGEEEEAVDLWRQGLKAQYADAAGGVRLPLLLYVASVLEPKLISLSDSKALLRTKASSPSVKKWRFWPGPLAEFVVGRIDETELNRLAATEHVDETIGQQWEGAFYKGILALERGDQDEFRRAMRETCAAARLEHPERHTFLGMVWREELYIARHAAGE